MNLAFFCLMSCLAFASKLAFPLVSLRVTLTLRIGYTRLSGIGLRHGLTLIGGIGLRLWASLNPRCNERSFFEFEAVIFRESPGQDPYLMDCVP